MKSKKVEKCRYFTTKCRIIFHELSPNPVRFLNFEVIYSPGSIQIQQKFAIDRIQSNPSPVQCSSLICITCYACSVRKGFKQSISRTKEQKTRLQC